MAIDVETLRRAVLQNMNRGEALPTDPSKQVVVDKDGNVLMGDKIQPGQQVTQVPQEVFA